MQWRENVRNTVMSKCPIVFQTRAPSVALFLRILPHTVHSWRTIALSCAFASRDIIVTRKKWSWCVSRVIGPWIGLFCNNQLAVIVNKRNAMRLELTSSLYGRFS